MGKGQLRLLIALLLSTLASSFVGVRHASPAAQAAATSRRRSTELPQESEEERLRQDQLARDRMAEHMQRVKDAQARAAESGEVVVDRAAWKWAIRQRVWDMLEQTELADEPRPVHHRIPNFKGAASAAQLLATLPEFQSAQCIKCNPDTPQKQVRLLTLQADKTLLVPQPRLRTGFFSRLLSSEIPKGDLLFACTSQGVKQYGEPLPIDNDPPLPRVDLIVVGSVAVDSSTGARLGKGEGFAELEYGMLRMLGAIDDSTPIITTIRDEQLVSDIPTDQLLRHDVPVDIIVTNTRVIRTHTRIPKPTGIYWDLLSPEKLAGIRVLQVLKKKIEEETGQPLPTGPSEVLPPIAERFRREKPAIQAQQGQPGARRRRNYNVVLRNLPYTATAEEVSDLVAAATGAVPTFVSMRSNADGQPMGMAFIELKHPDQAPEAIVALSSQELGGRKVVAREWIQRN